jgi:hypothetical protein
MYNPPVFYLILIFGSALGIVCIEVSLQLYIKSIVNKKTYQLINLSEYLIVILLFLYVLILIFYKRLYYYW